MLLQREKVLSQILPDKEWLDARNEAGIEKYRKGDFTLSFPVPVSKVSVKQKKSSFLFGSTVFMLDSFEVPAKESAFRQKFTQIFNHGVVPLYWSDLEPEEGRLRFSKESAKIYRRPPVDVAVEFCRQNNLTMKGHCLTWNCSVPSWVAAYAPEERKGLLERRYRQIAEKYAAVIPYFDIVNESATNYNFGRKVLFEGYDEYGLELGAKYFPQNHKILNETNTAIWTNFAKEGKYCAFNMQLREFLAKKLPFDQIGLQYHMFCREDEIANGNSLFLSARNMVDALELFNGYGLPMHISEITIPSYAGSIPQNEALQAEIAEIMYRTWFATEQMKGIVWWNMVDGYAAYAPLGVEEGENRYASGLLRFDMSEKPAFKRLEHLINDEWKTFIEVENIKDRFCFRGFYGEYEITADGRRFSVRLERDGQCEFLV